MKKNKLSAGFTLLEILTVAIIIVLLATIILIFLGGSRDKAKQTKIQSDLEQLSKAAELLYANNSYAALPASPDATKLKQDIAQNGGQLNVLVNGGSYVAYSVYPGAATGHVWCIDSAGHSKDSAAIPANNATACP